MSRPTDPGCRTFRMLLARLKGFGFFGMIVCFVLLTVGTAAASQDAGSGPSAVGPTDLNRLLGEGGATVLNVMSRIECLDSRIPGSVCLSTGDPAEQLARIAPDRSRPLVLYCGIPGCSQWEPFLEAARSLGYKKASMLKGGMEAWKEAGFAVESPSRIPRKPMPAIRPAALKGWLEQKRPLTVLDIRTPGAYEKNHIGEAVHIPLEALHERYPEIPLDRPVLVVDDQGERSFLAASYLRRKGLDAWRLFGGMRQWQAFLEQESKSRGRK